MGYTLKVLSDREFGRLPYKGTLDALGVADPRTNVAYVRHTVLPQLNSYLIHHELDHLVEEVPTDEEDGVRYKKGRQVLGNVAAVAGPIIGGAIGGPGGAALGGAAGGALKGGIGGEEKSGRGALIGAGIGGASGYAGSKLTGNFGIPQATQSGPNFASRIGTGASSGFGIGNILKSFTGLAGGVGSSGMPGMGSPAGGSGGPGGGIGLLKKPVTSAVSNTGTVGNTGGFLNSLFTPKNILGSGALGLGLMKSFPKVPELPQSAENLRSKVEAGGSPLGQFSQQQLTGLMNQQFQPLSEPEIQASLTQLDKDQRIAEDRVRDLYRNLRPGTDPSTDSSFRRDLQEVQDQFARAKSDTLANRTRDIKTQFDQQRLQQIQLGIGASDAEMQRLVQIAELDIYQIMTQLDLDVQQATQFKNTFVNLGTSMLNPHESVLDKLFR